MKNIAVFLGGQSVEHDVSIITGVLTLNTLFKAGYNAFPIYIDQSGVWYTSELLKDPDCYKNLNYKKLTRVALIGGSNKLYMLKGKKIKEICTLSAVVNCMHGERGEDGTLAGILNACGIPLASPDIASSSLSMNKALTKTNLRGLKIKVVNGIVVSSVLESKRAVKEIGFPLIVKPNCGGSSIGVRKANNERELSSAVAYALRFGESVLIERCLENFTELNCGAYLKSDGTIEVSECEQPAGKDQVLTFSDKYVAGSRLFPAPVPKEVSSAVKRITRKVYQKLGFSGVIRIDFLYCNGEIYLNEINSVPGSLAYYLFCKDFNEFANMLNEIISVAEKKFAIGQTLQKTFNSGILSFVGSKGAKRL